MCSQPVTTKSQRRNIRRPGNRPRKEVRREPNVHVQCQESSHDDCKHSGAKCSTRRIQAGQAPGEAAGTAVLHSERRRHVDWTYGTRDKTARLCARHVYVCVHLLYVVRVSRVCAVLCVAARRLPRFAFIHSFIHMPPWGVSQGGYLRGSVLHVCAVSACAQFVRSTLSVSCGAMHVDDDLFRAWGTLRVSCPSARRGHTTPRGPVQRCTERD